MDNEKTAGSNLTQISVKSSRETPSAIDHLRECFAYDAKVGLFTWLRRPRSHFKTARDCSAWNTRHAGTIAGSRRRDGRIDLNVDGVKWRAHRVAWALSAGRWPACVVDHIDGNASNNAIANLRECSLRQNQFNRVACKRNRLGMKGVTWLPNKRKFRAAIRINGRQTHLGLFADAESASAVYRAAAGKHHGAFANHKIRNAQA